jgi:hypothetical protein
LNNLPKVFNKKTAYLLDAWKQFLLDYSIGQLVTASESTCIIVLGVTLLKVVGHLANIVLFFHFVVERAMSMQIARRLSVLLLMFFDVLVVAFFGLFFVLFLLLVVILFKFEKFIKRDE